MVDLKVQCGGEYAERTDASSGSDERKREVLWAKVEVGKVTIPSSPTGINGLGKLGRGEVETDDHFHIWPAFCIPSGRREGKKGYRKFGGVKKSGTPHPSRDKNRTGKQLEVRFLSQSNPIPVGQVGEERGGRRMEYVPYVAYIGQLVFVAERGGYEFRALPFGCYWALPVSPPPLSQHSSTPPSTPT